MTSTLPTQEQVDRIAAELAPDVVRIRLNIKPDWSECPAMYFKITLSDEASQDRMLSHVARRVREELVARLGLDQFEHFPYFRFRNVSEQAILRDESWA